jgi:hypothetical protein
MPKVGQIIKGPVTQGQVGSKPSTPTPSSGGPEMKGFMELTERQFASNDFDSEHPVHLYLVKKHKLTYEQGVWLSFLYMAFYDEASAWSVFKASDPFTTPKNTSYPIGRNRRNLFGPRIITHFDSLRQNRKKAKDWPTHNFTGEPKQDWTILNNNLGDIWGNGRFGKYTTAEMLQKVNGIPVEITGFDNKGSSGPADGVQRLYKCGFDLASLDLHAELAYQQVLQSGLKPAYTSVDRGVVESVLCNYSGICRGLFYSGRNVDRQQGRILKVEQQTGKTLHPLWEARHAVMRKQDLGEFNGWVGIDKSRLKSFVQLGRVLWTYEER